MMSLLPKLADKNFILSCVVPSLLFGVILTTLFPSTIPVTIWTTENAGDTIGGAIYTIIAIWLFAVLLGSFNYLIYRALEGYIPPLKWLYCKKKQYQRQIDALQNELVGLFQKLRTARLAGEARSEEDLKRYRILYRRSRSMPRKADDAMPTSFGNAIKSFETYAREVYGVDAVAVWPRLSCVASKEYSSVVAEARTQVDFLVNCTVVSFLTSGASIILLIDRSHSFRIFSGTYFSWFVASSLIGLAFYKLAVYSIPAWGELVNAGFDCYLPPLAKQLGFDLPKTSALRRQFWRDFSEQVVYRLRPDGTDIFVAEKWSLLSAAETEAGAGDVHADGEASEAPPENDSHSEEQS